jgi:hypothetical protein
MATNTTRRLETGWLPDTPLEDTLLRRFVLTYAASWESVGRVAGGVVHHDDRCSIVDLGRPAGLFNSATLLQPLRGELLDETLQTIEHAFDAGGQGSAMLWSPWPTPDLRSRGWELEGHPPLLVRPPGPVTGQPHHPGSTEVTNGDELARWNMVVIDGFPLDEVDRATDLLPAGILEDDRWRFVLAHEDDVAVAAGSQFVANDLNLLVLAATRPQARGRGHYSALATDRIAHRGDLPAAAIVSDDSRPVLVRRFGFVAMTRFTLWTRSRQ